jgi:hypothetical protein
MHRYALGAEARANIVTICKAGGRPIADLAALLGAHVNNVRSVVARMSCDGDLFTCRVCAEGRQTHEVWVFSDMSARDAFHAQCERRSAQLQRRCQAEYRERNKALHAERARRARAQAAAARAEQKAQELAAKLEQAIAQKHAADIRRAERELARQKARQQREHAAAEKDRQRKAAKAAQLRLKAETKAAGMLGKPKGTASPAPAKVRGPAFVAGELDLSRARITKAPTPRGRYEVDAAPSVISSRECRAWAEAAAA